MIVLDPVTLGDVAFSRPSPKWVYDRTGMLVQVPADVPAVTYDPADLSKAPYVLIEPEAMNLIASSETFGAGWSAGLASAPSSGTYRGRPYCYIAKATANSFEYKAHNLGAVPAGQVLVATLALRAGATDKVSVGLIDWIGSNWGASANAAFSILGPGSVVQQGGRLDISGLSLSEDTFIRLSRTYVDATSSAGFLLYPGTQQSTKLGDSVQVTCMQVEQGSATSYIPTASGPVTRAADVIGTTAGLLYSNVPITEPAYDVNATYAKDAAVYDPVSKIVYWSMLDANKGNPLSDPLKWNKRGATNRRAAFDDRNNTQSTSAEELLFVLSPRAIAQGLFLGNVDGSEVRVSMAVPNFGVAYSETRSLVMSTSNSSFFRWGFNRIRRMTSFLSLKLPNFYNGLVTIAIRRPGGVAKCGMCMIGPTVEPGPTLVGLSTEIKDYSTTLFNVDGSSSTIERGYRKLMSLDVVIDTENIEQAEDQMIAWRQRTAVWIGAAGRPDSIICGRYSSFKKVIESYPQSKMALQIEGVLS